MVPRAAGNSNRTRAHNKRSIQLTVHRNSCRSVARVKFLIHRHCGYGSSKRYCCRNQGYSGYIRIFGNTRYICCSDKYGGRLCRIRSLGTGTYQIKNRRSTCHICSRCAYIYRRLLQLSYGRLRYAPRNGYTQSITRKACISHRCNSGTYLYDSTDFILGGGSFNLC